MTEVINLFRDRDILDELGLGSIRDWAFADLFFPGLSTVQTRARYFLFVPWMYLRIEESETPAAQVAQRFRSLHTELVLALERGGAQSGGIIGIQSRELTRILSHRLYWRGLGLFGIRRFTGTIDAYERSLDTYRRRGREAPQFEEGEFISTGPSANWDRGIPRAPDKFLRNTDFQLSVDEASYLKERIVQTAPQSLLAHLLERNVSVDDIQAPWLQPDLADFPSHLVQQLQHARLFALVTQGAVALYRLMLAEASENSDLAEQYIEGFEEWKNTLEQDLPVLASWDIADFWQLARRVNPNIPLSAEFFVSRWTDLVLQLSGDVANSEDARILITNREYVLKRSMARLTNKPALETWNGAPVARPFSYRWRSARVIIADILSPLTVPVGERSADA